MITWKDTIDIIIQTLECTQQDIAERLEIEKSHLSKVKSGRLNAPSEVFEPAKVYAKIFDTNAGDSLAHKKNKKNEKYLLTDFKMIIEQDFKEVKCSMSDCWDSTDYHTFIMKLLERTRRTPTGNHKNTQFELCHILPEKPPSFGRDDELKEISAAFESGSYVVLTGMGGIGKSHLAVLYAHMLNVDGNWVIQYIICEDSESLQQALCKLKFSDLPENESVESPEEVIARLKTHKKNALLILDNLNTPFKDDDRKTFQKLTQCNIRILMTSRYPLIEDKRHLVNILSLDDSWLLKLYEYYRFEYSADHSRYISQNQATLQQMFSLVERHTLMVVLLAKLPRRCFLDEGTILKLMKAGLPLPTEHVGMEQDGSFVEDTIYGIVKALFNISKLSEQEKAIMMCMTIIPNSGISAGKFRDLTCCAKRDIDNLIKAQWIIADAETFQIRLHPLIREALLTTDEAKEFWQRAEFQVDSNGLSENKDVDIDDVDDDYNVPNGEAFHVEADDSSIEKLASSFSNKAAGRFIWRVLRERRDQPSEGPLRHKLDQIVAAYASRVVFRLALLGDKSYINDFNCFKDEYRDSIIKLNKALIAYTDTDPEQQNFVVNVKT